MRYQGSKAKLAKDLIPIITEKLTDDKFFIDLFGGGMNLVCNVNHKKKIACDINSYIIALWQTISAYGMDCVPQNVTLEDYCAAKEAYLNNDFSRFSRAQIGYIATCCSYGGGWFSGYAHFNPKKNEDHIKEAYNGLKKQVENFKYLRETDFCEMSYEEIETYPYVNLKNSIIYADPPYCNTKRYESDFNHVLFWEWVRNITKAYGTKIYISEYEAPTDFKCVWQKDVADGMGTTKTGMKQNRKIEKLFVYNG